MNGLAPIVLFVFKRPEHTKRVLESLERNPLARESTLYVYADGPGAGATKDELAAIRAVRDIVRSRNWCNRTIMVEADENLGLARSIIGGVTAVLDENDRVIVLEDDTCPAPGFLRFMNDNLCAHEHSSAVSGLGGWSVDLDVEQDAYFIGLTGSWGWATWRRVWKQVSFDGEALLRQIEASGRTVEFDADGNYPYMAMLRQQVNGRIDSWAIRFYASCFLKRKLFLVPTRSLISNIGTEGSGTHGGVNRELGDRVLTSVVPASAAYLGPVEEDPQIRARVVARIGQLVSMGSRVSSRTWSTRGNRRPSRAWPGWKRVKRRWGREQ